MINFKENIMKNKILVTTVLLFTTIFVNAQISKSNADNLVLHNIVNDSTIMVYCMNESLGLSAKISLADGEEIINPYEESYVYFIDDIPAANWEHPCRYCFINRENGLYTIVNKTIYPYNNETFTRIGNRLISNRVQWPYTSYTIPPKAAPNSKLYAVLIAGDIGPNGSDKKAWYNLSCVYTALVNKYGFIEGDDVSHLIVCAKDDVKYAMTQIYANNSTLLYPDQDLNHSGDAINCLDFNHTYNSRQTLSNIFNNLSGVDNDLDDVVELTENDQLFVFVCGVGSTSGNNHRIMLSRGSNAEYLYDYDLANWVRNIKCSQMTFLIDCNFSGGFVDDLMNDANAVCKNRAVHTSTDATHYSWAERHITGNNRGGGGDEGDYLVDEYVYYWSAASLGHYPILEIYSDSISGPWNRYYHTSIGQFEWYQFPSFNDPNGMIHAAYDVSPDANNDGVVSMEEAFLFADNLDSYSRRGFFKPYEMFYTNQNNQQDTCVEYPCHSYESSFTKELISLSGYRGRISHEAETGAGRNYILDGRITVDENATLTFNNNSTIGGINKVLVNNGTLLTNSNNNVTFKKVSIKNDGGTLALSHCIFDTCGVINTIDGSFSITNSVFNETCINANDGEIRDANNVIISDNIFYNTSFNNTIELSSASQCNVSNNNITSGNNGIYLRGLIGVYTNYSFSNNYIHDCAGSGFVSYNSNGQLSGNHIANNDIDGIQSFNLSNLHVSGYNTAPNYTETQYMITNGRYQFYATNNSYPQNFHYNWLVGNGTSTDTILFFESNNPQNNRPLIFDVSYNCWYPLADNNIPSHIAVTGNALFNYLPTWTPTGPYSLPEGAGAQLYAANELAGNGSYDEAKDAYKHIIAEYPQSPEAITALKALLSVEISSRGNFIDLQTYYMGLRSDDYLGSAADNLANICDVKTENYMDAINWYENKITNPNTSYSERIFAEIDLGDLYIQMNYDGNKGIQGKLVEYIPVSKEAHEARSKYLLSLLPGNEEHSAAPSIKETQAMVSTKIICFPNPAKDDITLSYTLNDDADVEVSISGILGNEVQHVCCGKQTKGYHSVEFDLSNIPDGIYLGCLKIDNNHKKTVKIIIKH